MTYPRISVTIPTRHEGDWLTKTAQSLLRYEPGVAEIVHVDDASELPEPDLRSLGAKVVRNPVRRGAARSRAIGFNAADESCNILATSDGHILFGQGECAAALTEEIERFKLLGRQGRIQYDQNYQIPQRDMAAMLAPDKLSRLAALCEERNCLGYLGTARMGIATAVWNDGLLQAQFMGLRETEVVESACPFGGVYLGTRDAWDRIGGYPQLPGGLAYEEPTIALLAAATDVKIITTPNASPWHLYRGQGCDPIPVPHTQNDGEKFVNWAACYRLAFSEAMWQARWKPALVQVLNKSCRVPPLYVVDEVESATFTDYRDALQEGFVRRDGAILEELERRMAQDKLWK